MPPGISHIEKMVHDHRAMTVFASHLRFLQKKLPIESLIHRIIADDPFPAMIQWLNHSMIQSIQWHSTGQKRTRYTTMAIPRPTAPISNHCVRVI